MPRPKQKRNKKKQQAKQRQKRQKEKEKDQKEEAAANSGRRTLHPVNKNLPDLPGIKRPKYEVLTDRKMTLDHGRSYWYCNLPIFKGERKVEDPWVQTLWDQMKRGSFNERLVILSTCEFGGVTYKINGQHTCWALIEMPPSFTIEVREIRYKVTTQADLKALYSTFDRNKVRSDDHCIKVRMVNTEATEGIHLNTISSLSKGMKMWLFESKTERARYRDVETNVLINQHMETFRSVGFMLQDNKDIFKDVNRQPVIAAMMATFDKVPRIARQFWQSVIDGLNLTQKADPRWRLKKYLAESALSSTSRGSTRKPVDREAMYRVCIAAWNKWRKDEPANMTIRPTKRRVKPA